MVRSTHSDGLPHHSMKKVGDAEADNEKKIKTGERAKLEDMGSDEEVTQANIKRRLRKKTLMERMNKVKPFGPETLMANSADVEHSGRASAMTGKTLGHQALDD